MPTRAGSTSPSPLPSAVSSARSTSARSRTTPSTPGAARPGGGRHRRRLRGRDAPRGLLHGRVLSAPHRRARAGHRAAASAPRGHDQQHRFAVLEPIAAPDGLGVVDGVRVRAQRERRGPSRSRIPGPFTLSGRLTYGAGRGLPRPHRRGAGVRAHPGRGAGGARGRRRDVHPGRRALPGHPPGGLGRVRRALQRRDRRRRRSRPSRGAPLLRQLPRVGRSRSASIGPCWSRRSPSTSESSSSSGPTARWPSWTWPPTSRPPAGTSRPASSTSRATTSRPPTTWPGGSSRLLAAGVPEAQLSLVPDCGFSQTARWATKPKLAALVAGRDLVRGRAG